MELWGERGTDFGVGRIYLLPNIEWNSLSVSMLKRPLSFHEPRERVLFTIPRKVYPGHQITVLFLFVCLYHLTFFLDSLSWAPRLEWRRGPCCHVLGWYSGLLWALRGQMSSVPGTLRLGLSAGDNKPQFMEWRKRDKVSFEVKTIFDQNKR